MLYNNLSSYLKKKYDGRISKICIDGGFSCPNRDGKCGTGGCVYCGERGAGEHINSAADISSQVEAHLARNTVSDGFVAYFQNFTNTYADVTVLKEKYDSALISDKIKVLAIGTRPDCITEEIADLLLSYTERVDVWVELGLQNASDTVAVAINRGYNTEVFVKAANILRKRGIPFVVHMIIGLPEETEESIDLTVDLINSVGAWGVKIHSIYVMEGTRLAEMYREGVYTPPSREYYVRLCARSIARLAPDIIVHRITGDCPGGMLVAPEWNSDKNTLIDLIRRKLEDDGMRQGVLFNKVEY